MSKFSTNPVWFPWIKISWDFLYTFSVILELAATPCWQSLLNTDKFMPKMSGMSIKVTWKQIISGYILFEHLLCKHKTVYELSLQIKD